MSTIALNLARRLKANGLTWTPQIHDFFAIPDRGMDDRVFVISEVMSNLGTLKGAQVVLFHGTAEWALDYLVSTEAIWLPTEGQLRQLVREQLLSLTKAGQGSGTNGSTQAEVTLTYQGETSICQYRWAGGTRTFQAEDAAGAYALALLDLLAPKPDAEG